MEDPPAKRPPECGVDLRTKAFLTAEMFLRRVVQSRLPNADAVDEVIQEVAVALTKAKSVPLDQIQPWLCRVAIRQALLFRRRQGRRQNLHSEYSTTASHPSPQDRDPLLWMLAGERRHQLQGALSRLRSEDQKILTMKYVDGLDYRRISVALDISEHAVANRLRTAREKLRQELHDFHTDPDFSSRPR